MNIRPPATAAAPAARVRAVGVMVMSLLDPAVRAAGAGDYHSPTPTSSLTRPELTMNRTSSLRSPEHGTVARVPWSASGPIWVVYMGLMADPAPLHSCRWCSEGSESAAGSYDPRCRFGAGHLAPDVSSTGRRVGIRIEPTALTFYDLDTPRVLGTRTHPLQYPWTWPVPRLRPSAPSAACSAQPAATAELGWGYLWPPLARPGQV